ncbi:MAG: hypothetical protein AAGJ81_08120 [Verrucomicrobiota bacterium]
MSTDASTVIAGPAYVGFDGISIYTEEDIEVSVTKETRDHSVRGFGTIDDTLLDVMAEITVMPAQWVDAHNLIYYSCLSAAIGSRIFGDVDKPIVIQSMTEGKRYTYARGAITTPPPLGLGVEKDLIGSLTLTALKGNATELSAANSIVALSDTAFTDTSFNEEALIHVPYSVAWGASPFNDIETEDGVDVTFDLSLEPVKTDKGGTIDMRVTDLRASATLIPVNLSHANLLEFGKMQGTGVARGTKMGRAFGRDLVMDGGSGAPKVTLKRAIPLDLANRLGTAPHLAGTFNFRSTRTITNGRAGPVAVIETSS